MKYTSKLTSKLLKKTLSRNEFDEILHHNDTFFNDLELEKELLISNGYPLEFEEDSVKLKTKHTNLKDQIFCIVDIETTAGKVKDGQIIELAAIKLQNGKIIDEYESLAYAKDIPRKVQELTGITPDMLDDAPDVKTVLEEFKIFLEDDVFVAHSVSFDYKFISDSLKKYDLGELCNRKLCTIDLAKRTIVSNKYGLSTLKELLQIESLMHHRAYYDVLSTVSVFKESFKNLPSKIIYTEDLIDFSKTGKSLELKLDPINLENSESLV